MSIFFSPTNSHEDTFQRKTEKDFLNNQQNSGNTSFDADVINDLGLGAKEKKPTRSTGENAQVGDFMRLFLEQLKHQDPLNPQEGADFLGQLAQFNSVERLVGVEAAIDKLATSFQSSRILEATGMIGKQIHVPTNQMQLTSKEVDGKNIGNKVISNIYMPDELPEGAVINDVIATVTNSKGELIDNKLLGPQQAGTKIEFVWNGHKDPANPSSERLVDSNKEPIEDGNYQLSVQAVVNGRTVPVNRTDISTKVDSVSIDQESGIIRLNASGIGTVKLSEVDNILD